jgi:hypothetical protein
MNAPNQLKLAAFFRAHALQFAGITFLLILAWRLQKHFDMNWDTLSYHLPFISYRAGFENNTSFVMLDVFQHRFLGFPPLADYFQAAFWQLTGNISTITLINPLAIACLALYLAYTYRLSIFWTVLIFVAIPALHVNVDSAYIDLWTNSFFALFLISTFETIHKKDHSCYIHAIISLLSLAIAVNSKPQFTVIGGIAFVLLMATLITKLIQSSDPQDMRRFSIVISIFVVAAPIAFYIPIRNVIAHEVGWAWARSQALGWI